MSKTRLGPPPFSPLFALVLASLLEDLAGALWGTHSMSKVAISPGLPVAIKDAKKTLVGMPGCLLCWQLEANWETCVQKTGATRLFAQFCLCEQNRCHLETGEEYWMEGSTGLGARGLLAGDG